MIARLGRALHAFEDGVVAACLLAMAAMMIALLWLGLYPQPVLDLAQPVLDQLQAMAPGSRP